MCNVMCVCSLWSKQKDFGVCDEGGEGQVPQADRDVLGRIGQAKSTDGAATRRVSRTPKATRKGISAQLV